MRVILSGYPERVEKYGHMWGNFVVFEAPHVGPREAHRLLAVHAGAEGWDETVRVSQDDVTVDAWPVHVGDVTAYSPRRRTHVCPKAFTATPGGWRRLAWQWSKPGRTCELWKPDHTYDTVRSI